MKSPSTRPVSRRMTRIAGIGIALGAALAGCVSRSLVAETEIASDADYDHYFYNVPGEDVASLERIKQNIERLGGPAWEQAKNELFYAGKQAIEELIRNLDRTDPTHVGLRSMPGRAVPEKTEEWLLGDVVYAVLAEFIGSYTDYEGQIPPADKTEWERWFGKQHRSLNVKAEIDTAPKYVREQFVAVQLALESRFVDVREKAKRAEAKASRDRREEQQKQAQREKRRRAEAKERRAKAKAEAEKEAAERKAEEKRAKKEKEKETYRSSKEKVEEKEREAKEPPPEEPEEEPKRSRRSRRRRD